jgi:hypothetical protein
MEVGSVTLLRFDTSEHTEEMSYGLLDNTDPDLVRCYSKLFGDVHLKSSIAIFPCTAAFIPAQCCHGAVRRALVIDTIFEV